MKVLPSETKDTSKRQGRRFWLTCLPLLVSPLLLYYGYCWGLWGRSSLLLQYLFQCSCPPSSEEARYPEYVDVIVPACDQSYIELSPSGRFLQVNEEKLGITSTYILDLQTMQKVPAQSFSRFLTDDLGFIKSNVQYYIVDRITGKQYPIQKFAYWRSDAYINGYANLNVLIEALRESKDIFLIEDDIIVALVQDFHLQPERNFFLPQSAFPGSEIGRMERFLRENGIKYQTIPTGVPSKAVSPDGRFIARSDGIYLSETEQKIADGYSLSVMGWTYDGRGVIYSHALGRCLLRIGLPFGDDTGCFTRIPQSVLRINVPEKYLLSTQPP